MNELAGLGACIATGSANEAIHDIRTGLRVAWSGERRALQGVELTSCRLFLTLFENSQQITGATLRCRRAEPLGSAQRNSLRGLERVLHDTTANEGPFMPAVPRAAVAGQMYSETRSPSSVRRTAATSDAVQDAPRSVAHRGIHDAPA